MIELVANIIALMSATVSLIAAVVTYRASNLPHPFGV